MKILRKLRHMWYSVFRNETTGQYMSREQVSKADPDDVMEHKRRRKPKGD